MRTRALGTRTWLGIVAALGLAACPSDDPKGGDTETGTTGGATESADGTVGSGDCGNGVIDEGEQCDGEQLGGATCTDVNPAYTGGTVVCGASCTLDATGCELPPNTPLVTLNEVTSDQVLEGDYAGINDAIELYNAGTGTADLSGWQISDDPMLLVDKTYTIPAGTMLEPSEALVLRSIDTTTMTGELPFGLDASGVETLVLVDAAGTGIDEVSVDGYLARVSYCRVPDGTGAWLQCEQTFGGENQAADTACGNDVVEDAEACDGTDLAGNTCEGLGLGYSGGTMACRPTCKLDADGCTTDSELVINELSSTSDEIEIFNGGNTAADLSGLVLTDDRVDATYDPVVDTAELVFPAGTMLAAGAYLVVQPGLGPGQHPFGLGAMGDRVTLLDPASPTIIDQVSFEAGQAATSWCRQPDGPGGAWQECAASMGSAN